MDLSEDEIKIIQDHSDKADYYKSRVLDFSAGFEVQIESFLIKFFKIGNFELFYHIFFHASLKIFFSDKINMLERLLKSQLQDFLSKNQNLIDDLNKIRKMRNEFAHTVTLANVQTNEQLPWAQKKIIRLADVKDGKIIYHEYDYDHFEELLKKGEKVNKQLYDLINTI